MNLMDRGDQDVKWSWLVSDTVSQYYFYFFLIILIYILWGNWLIYKIIIQFLSNTPVYIYLVSTLELFLGVSVFSWCTSQWRYHWRGEMLRWRSAHHKDIVHDLCCSMCEESLSITDFCWYLKYWIWRNIDLGSHLVWNIISLIYDKFTRVVHEILHVISEENTWRFYWGINITNQYHGEVLNIIHFLDGYLHDSTNPVIEITPMLFFKLF